ncbi:prephenate dehydratase domain-containing protein [Thermodesulfobium sp. 4217-1]|uniref:prephenate dehydratase n=1 Tax=Thermodesulfobium sp. 4217-1 TaxID=3120013 RepID=UPI003221AF0C
MKKIFTVLFLAFILFQSKCFADVCYLGPAGTYSEEASMQYFGSSEKLIPNKTVTQSIDMLKEGKCQYAVVPVENTIGGPVYNYLELVAEDDSLTVVGKVDLPIRQALLVWGDTQLKNIKTVYSHPQGISQSKEWLKQNLPDAKIVEVSSTAEASKKVSELKDNSSAAIASEGSAKVYHLNVLAHDIQMNDSNVTRFWVVTNINRQNNNGDHYILVLTGDDNQAVKLLDSLENSGYKIGYIHDIPRKTYLGDYIYIVELNSNSSTTNINDLIDDGAYSDLNIHILGRY